MLVMWLEMIYADLRNNIYIKNFKTDQVVIFVVLC